MRTHHLILPAILMLVAFATDLTVAEEESKRPFSFVVVGHVRGRADGELNSLLDEMLTEVCKLRPDMVFLTGDMIWGCIARGLVSTEGIIHPTFSGADPEVDWDRLDAKLERLGVPIYRVPGNHDIAYPVSRDIYFARYGYLPQVVTYQGSRFILLNSSAIPQGDIPAPWKYMRGKPLDSKQIDFIRKELSEGEAYDHAFLFMHHLLWWNEDAPWWRNVHPLLVGRNVRAVFGGDSGPMKFSHMRRDEIHYLQSGIEQDYAIENYGMLKVLRTSEGDRLLAQQLDNFLYVTVDGPQVTIEVKTVGAMSSGKFSPQRFREVHGDVGYRVEMAEVETSLVKRVWAIVGTPKRLGALALAMAICVLGGVTIGVVWSRRKAG